MNRISKQMLAGLIAIFLGQAQANATTDMEVLLQILEQRGAISKEEANTVLQETQAAITKNKQKEIALNAKVDQVSSVSQESQRLKWAGDIRIRHDSQTFDDATDPSRSNRSRERYRARFGLTYGISDNTKMGITLASGELDVGSTNQSANDAFDPKDIYLDQAYVQHDFYDGELEFKAGKYKNPFSPYTWLIFDSDLRFEGADAKINGSFGEAKTHTILGFFPLDESSSAERDPYLAAIQFGFDSPLGSKSNIDTKLAYFHFESVSAISGLDRVRTGNNPDSRFEVINLTTSLSLNVGIPLHLTLDLLHNNAESTENQGWLLGTKFGDKVKKFGDFQSFFTYSVLQADATFDQFTDSDFHSGGTNSQGWTVGYSYGLGKGWKHALKYYDTQEESGVMDKERRIQIDLKYKF